MYIPYQHSSVVCVCVCVCVSKGDVWICMELLDTSMDKISDRVYQQLQSTIPEDILGKMTVSVSPCSPTMKLS